MESVEVKSVLSKDTPPKLLPDQDGHGESRHECSWGMEG